jgi:hypothetical protein
VLQHHQVFPSHENATGGINARDWFATRALVGLLANSGRPGNPDEVAAQAYTFADALLT